MKQPPGKALAALTLGLLSATLTAAVFYLSMEGYGVAELIAVALPFFVVIFVTLRFASSIAALRKNQSNHS